MLRPRERRRPVMPNQLSAVIEQWIVAFALGHPGLGPRRISAQLARPEWGGLVVSPNGVYKALVRHGLNTRAERLALVAGYRAPFGPPREPEPRIDTTSPGNWSASTAFTSVGCTGPPARLAAHRDRHLQLLRLGRGRHFQRLRRRRPTHKPPRRPRRQRPPGQRD